MSVRWVGTNWMDMRISSPWLSETEEEAEEEEEELKLKVSSSSSLLLSSSPLEERADSDCGMMVTIVLLLSLSLSPLPMKKRTCVAFALLGVVGLWKRRLRIGIGRWWVLGVVPGVKVRSTRAPMRGLVVVFGEGSQHIVMGLTWDSCCRWLSGWEFGGEGALVLCQERS